MADSALSIADLPAIAPSALDGTELVELQKGTGADSGGHATLADIAALIGGSGGSGGIAWQTVSAATMMAANNAYIVTAAVDMTLPASVSAGDQFIVHALGASVRIVSNGNVINRVGSGNNLTLADKQTAWLVSQSAGNLEIV